MIFIAEVKTDSPWGFHTDRCWEELFEIAAEHGDWVSIHTHPAWGGSFEHIQYARKRTDKPILAKGLHWQEHDLLECHDAGADYALCLGMVPQSEHRWEREPNDIKLIYEPVFPNEWKRSEPFHPEMQEQRVVWNARNVITGGRNGVLWETARAAGPHWLVQASSLRTVEDVKPDADAVLVGAYLPEFVESLGLTESGTLGNVSVRRGVEQSGSRRAHNPEAVGSNPTPATISGHIGLPSARNDGRA